MKTGLRFALLFLLMCPPAKAAYEVESGAALICDTQEQIERIAQVFDEDMEDAISTVNAEVNNQKACAMVDVAYVQGRQLGTVRSRLHTFQIFPIIVVGASATKGYQLVEPSPFWMLVEIRELGV
jgi:hypothetical protein